MLEFLELLGTCRVLTLMGLFELQVELETPRENLKLPALASEVGIYESKPVWFHHNEQNETLIILSMIQQNITTIIVGRF